MRGLVLEAKMTKVISCYENKGLPLHQECPNGKKEMDSRCNICCRKTEKIIQIKTEKETHFYLKGWKKVLFKLIFRR